MGVVRYDVSPSPFLIVRLTKNVDVVRAKVKITLRPSFFYLQA